MQFSHLHKYQCPCTHHYRLSLFLVQNKEDYAFSYYPSSDLLIISNNEKDGIVPVAIINDVRKRDSIMEAKNFPQELKNGEIKTAQ